VKLSAKTSRTIKIALTVALLIALLLTLDTSRFAAAIFHIDPAWMVLGIVLCFAFVAARMGKWMFLARANGLVAPRDELVRAMSLALALGIVTPGRIGEVAAIAPFPADARPRALLAYVFDRVGELATVLLFCAPAAVVYLPGWGLLLGSGLCVGAIVIVLAMQVRTLRQAIAARLPRRTPDRVRDVLGSAIEVPAGYWLFSGTTYLITYAAVAAFIAGSQAIASPSALLLLPPVTLSNLVTITVGGLGLREGLAALVGPAGGILAEVAAASFFLSFFWTRLVPGLVGLCWTLVRAAGFPPGGGGAENGRE
jgi:glycosyltransferase 2 family protein